MVNSFAGKNVLVMGLGMHGGAIAVVKWLLRHQAVITVTDIKTRQQLSQSIDKIDEIPGANKIKYTLGQHDSRDFITADIIIQNPGVPVDSPYLRLARKHKIPIINEAVMFFGLYQGSIIGVSGTRGKSTTSTILHKILQTKYKNHTLAGNIATNPMLEAIDATPPDSWPVLELSSWHLEILDRYQRSPQIAVLTNVLADHLNRYKSMASYAQAKFALLAHQKNTDPAILNFDNNITRSFGKKLKSRVYYFSLRQKVKGSYLKNDQVYFFDGKKEAEVMPLAKFQLPGEHNVYNLLAAVTAAKLLKIPNNKIQKALAGFHGVPYRLEYKATINGVQVYNDSTSTTPDACLAAIKSFPDKKIVLIAGGQNKNLPYVELSKYIAKKIKHTVLIPGTASDIIAKELKKMRYEKVSSAGTLKKAWQLAWSKCTAGSILLFSPAAASFNMFTNEFDRARQFDQIINDQKKRTK